jgi:predicted transcriptional regulator
MDTPFVIRTRILSLRNEGHTQKVIGELLNVSQSAISKILLKHRTTGYLGNTRGGACGRKRALSARQQRRITIESVRHPRGTAREIQAIVGGSCQALSISSMRRYLTRAGRFTFRPSQSPQLTNMQRRRRFLWAI